MRKKEAILLWGSLSLKFSTSSLVYVVVTVAGESISIMYCTTHSRVYSTVKNCKADKITVALANFSKVRVEGKGYVQEARIFHPVV